MLSSKVEASNNRLRSSTAGHTHPKVALKSREANNRGEEVAQVTLNTRGSWTRDLTVCDEKIRDIGNKCVCLGSLANYSSAKRT